MVTEEENVYYELTEELFFNSSISEKLISNQQIKEWAIIQVDNFLQHIEIGDSELIFHKINYLRIQYSKGKITRAGGYIQKPKTLKSKQGIVNIRNKTDDKCIIWCLLAYKYYDTINHNKKSETSTYKKYFDEIIQPKAITYPIDIQRDIPKFE